MKVLRLPELENPTVLILTDRNDLDDQIYEKFSVMDREHGVSPIQAETVEHLKELLRTPAGGVIFSTVQKFKAEGKRFPLLSNRKNIIVIADEAHRSHYNLIDGYARYIRDALPNALYAGFTATPIELGDRSTTQVFGEHIHVFDLSDATTAGVVVPVVYENRWAKIGLDNYSKEILDEEFEEVTETEEVEAKEALKRKWSRLEAVLSSESVLEKLAKDIVEHFEEREKIIEGKAMRHLARHKKVLGIGMSAEEKKLLEQAEGEQGETEEVKFEVAPEPTMDELIASIEEIVAQINDVIDSLSARIEKLEKANNKPEGNIAEKVLKNSAEPMIPVREAVEMVESVLPTPMVERSWSLGPQRLCQELRRVIFKLRKRLKENE